jgi:Flp pilus assembly protein TadG
MLVDRQMPSLHPHREGVAAVELAVCLPVLVVLVFAAIESCSMIYLTQALHCATYEGVRVAILPTADNQQVIQRTQAILDGHGINGATITLVPSDVSNADPGELVRVRIRTSCDANRISPSFFFGGRNVEVQTTMVKE